MYNAETHSQPVKCDYIYDSSDTLSDTNSDTNSDSDDECSICFRLMNDSKQHIAIMPCCKKRIHMSCYIACININNSCPYCRSIHTQHHHIVNIGVNDGSDENTHLIVRDYENVSIIPYCIIIVLFIVVISVFIYVFTSNGIHSHLDFDIYKTIWLV